MSPKIFSVFLKRTMTLDYIDMIQPNDTTKKKKQDIPTPEVVHHQLNGANHFSKLELNNGFCQIKLHPDS